MASNHANPQHTRLYIPVADMRVWDEIELPEYSEPMTVTKVEIRPTGTTLTLGWGYDIVYPISHPAVRFTVWRRTN